VPVESLNPYAAGVGSSPCRFFFALHPSTQGVVTMNAVTKTEAIALETAAPLEVADPTKNLILVPLSQLQPRRSKRNARTTPRLSIPELAASISRVGLLQNLIVILAVDGEQYEVVAGDRRLTALKLLAKKKRIAADHDVPCLLVPDASARTVSLAENLLREQMHPADQFEAFAALVKEGRPIEDIAADFGVSPLTVQRRLKLANVSPRLMTDYRAGAVTLEQLMALTITDDHAAQEAAYYSAPEWQRGASALRERLTEREIDATHPLVRFVGLNAYTAAGGGIRRDLFADDDSGTYLTDAALLETLVRGKLDALAEDVRGEGWAWVEAVPHMSHADRQTFQNAPRQRREPTAREARRIASLQGRLDKIDMTLEEAYDAEDEDQVATLEERREQVAGELEAIEDALQGYAPDVRAVAGAIVTLDREGEAVIHRGLLREQLSTSGHLYLHYGDIHTSARMFIDAVGQSDSIPRLDVPLGKIQPTALLADGDVVFVDASEDDDGVSKHVVVVNPHGVPFISGLHTIVAKQKRNELDSAYLRYCFQAPAVKEQFKFYAVGTKVSGVSKKNIAKITLSVPTREEQAAIAELLVSIDTNIEALELKLSKARQLKQGMMQALLTGRIRLVQPGSNVIPLSIKPTAVNHTPSQSGHNWQINEAVVIGVLAQRFGSEQFPLPRKRRVKLMYLLHRRAEGRAVGYLKKAAGPYDPNTKYKGPEAIALKSGYVRALRNEKYEGFVAGDKIEQAQHYFEQWYGAAALDWLEKFHYRKTDDLELLATVDMAMVDLAAEGQPADVVSVKRVIAAHPEWVAKLARELFSDDNIASAIVECQALLCS
jgi:ParB/RepB/Spo0J family partition protein